MKKVNKRHIFLILLILVNVVFPIGCNKPKDERIRQLDKKYANLNELKLRAPFDLEVLDTYMIIEFSTEVHMGIDFFSTDNVPSIPFLAMQDGLILQVEEIIMENQGGSDNWAYRITIALNSRYTMVLVFETFSPLEETRANQEKNIFVNTGDCIKQGDIIGNLMIGGTGAHVHFHIGDENQEGKHIAPEQFFTQEAIEQMTERLESNIKYF